MIRPLYGVGGYCNLDFSSIHSLKLFDKNVIDYILKDVEIRCGSEYIHTTYLSKPKLRREITDIYYNQTINKPLKDFYKSWFKTRLDRAHDRKMLIGTPRFFRLGYGYLLYDLINHTYKEQNYFRISNAYKRYKKSNSILVKKCLDTNLPVFLINQILKYVQIDLSYKMFDDIIHSNTNVILSK